MKLKLATLAVLALLVASCWRADEPSQPTGEVKADYKMISGSTSIITVEHEGWRYIIFSTGHGCCLLRLEQITTKP